MKCEPDVAALEDLHFRSCSEVCPTFWNDYSGCAEGNKHGESVYVRLYQQIDPECERWAPPCLRLVIDAIRVCTSQQNVKPRTTRECMLYRVAPSIMDPPSAELCLKPTALVIIATTLHFELMRNEGHYSEVDGSKLLK